MIRDATPADLPRLVELGRIMLAESRYGCMSYAPEKVDAMLRMAMERGKVLVAENSGEIIGLFAGICEEHWFSHDLIATDLALFVEPDKRGGMAATRLVNSFLDWAEARGAIMTDILINTGIRTAETAKLFDRFGGKAAGLIYSWRKV